jgi:hypothetical protein
VLDVYAFNDAWQYPAITEKQAYECIEYYSGSPKLQTRKLSRIAYLAFPWATLIDNTRKKGPQALFLLGKLREIISLILSSGHSYSRIITTCQHIHAYQHPSLFREAGITDIFWSHLSKNSVNDKAFKREFTVHPFPLYPAQAPRPIPFDKLEDERPVLFSFKGATSNQWYLSDARKHIEKFLSDDPLGHVEINDTWHYQKIVYENQVNLGRFDIDNVADVSYIESLINSKFSLCPVGTGPNTIRLWESINSASVPVVIGDYLELPSPFSMKWSDALVFIDDSPKCIMQLPTLLRQITQTRLLDMQHACLVIANEFQPWQYGRLMLEKITKCIGSGNEKT